MNIKRFHAATSREALAKARMAFGEGTLILSNRPTATGVEVVATAEETLHALNQDDMADARPQAAVQAAVPASASRPAPAVNAAPKCAGIRAPSQPVLTTARDTPAAAASLETALRAAGQSPEIFHYAADHAFFNKLRPEVYDAGAAELSWSRTLDFLGRHFR